MNLSDSDTGKKRSRVKGKGDGDGSLKRKVANDAIHSGEGSALGTMVINADTVTISINFNF